MQRLPGKTWFKTRTGIWVSAFVTLLLGVAILCLLLGRRVTVEYYLGHEFTVRDAEFFPSAHALADPLPVTGNKIELLHNGQRIFPAMLEAIRGAQESVNFEAFLFHSGEVASQFRDALAQRARAGVRVRILLDGMGSSTELDDSYVKALKEAGCSFAYYHAVRAWRIDRLNRRTHRRVLVVDGRIGFTGGVGFSDEWQGGADAPEHWREVHARLEGPIVGKLQAAFQEHWFKEFGETLSGKGEFPELPSCGESAGAGRGQPLVFNGAVIPGTGGGFFRSPEIDLHHQCVLCPKLKPDALVGGCRETGRRCAAPAPGQT